MSPGFLVFFGRIVAGCERTGARINARAALFRRRDGSATQFVPIYAQIQKPGRLTAFDQWVAAADRALRTLATDPPASRTSPAAKVPATSLSERIVREAQR